MKQLSIEGLKRAAFEYFVHYVVLARARDRDARHV